MLDIIYFIALLTGRVFYILEKSDISRGTETLTDVGRRTSVDKEMPRAALGSPNAQAQGSSLLLSRRTSDHLIP